VLERLIAKSDVFVENFRPGTLTRLGLDYQTLAARHPRLVYCSISGFGHCGPRWKEPGYDAIMQAEGGLMSITGSADGPPYRLGVAIVDIVSGMFAAYGIALALFARERTGRGQEVDLAMLDATVALAHLSGRRFLRDGQRAGPARQPASEHRAVRDVCHVGRRARDRRRQRRAVAQVLRVTGLPEEERFATNRQRVTPTISFAVGRRSPPDKARASTGSPA